MSAEFVDTNILVYAHDSSAGQRHEVSSALLERLIRSRAGAISTQVLTEFYSVATRKLRFSSKEVEEIVFDFGSWLLHCPTHASILQAVSIQRRFQINWWDALIVNSAVELDCSTLWTEDLHDGQQFSTVTARNPFA
jgi:predicted nucleic acid-binding protein